MRPQCTPLFKFLMVTEDCPHFIGFRHGAYFHLPLLFSHKNFKMKVVKVLYQKVFPLAQYVNEKIGIEIELDTSKGDDPDHAFDNAKSFVEKWHKLGNPSLHFSVAAPASIELPIIQNDTEERKLGISIEDIRSCNSLVVLDAYWKLVRDDQELTLAWDKRRAQLVKEGK